MLPVYNWLGPKPVVVRTFYENSRQSFSLLYDSKKHKTDLYDRRICAVRRDTSVVLSFTSKNGKFDAKKVSLKLVTKSEGSHFAVSALQRGPVVHGFKFYIDKFDMSSLAGRIQVHADAPIGLYHIQLMIGDTALSEVLSLYIVFNPLSPKDPVYMPDPAMIAQHLLGQKAYIFCGTARSHPPRTFKLHQFSLEVVLVTSYFCNKCSVDHRVDPVLISRDFTALVNSNDDQGLLTGNWSEDFSDGVSPNAWTSVRDICRSYLHGGSVKYGQCSVFAACYEAICKSCGIPCLTISMFPSYHDINNDGKLTRFLYSHNMATAPGGDFGWNYHCANNPWMHRYDVEGVGTSITSSLCWQHADATPQERSRGLYRCGPYPTKLVLAGAEPHGFEIPYDGKFIFTSINAAIEYFLVDKNMSVQRKFMKKHACDVITTGGPQGEEISLLDKYRQLKGNSDKPRTSKMKVHLQVPAKAHLTDELTYAVTVTGAPKGSSTIAALVLELVDQRGRNLIQARPPIKSFVFTESNVNFSGKSQPLSFDGLVDLTHAALFWEFRCFDESVDKLKVVREHTALAPSFVGQIDSDHISLVGPLDVSLTVGNELDQDIKDCVIVIKTKGQMDGLKQEVKVIPARSKKTFKVSIPDLEPGIIKLQLWIHSRLGVLLLASKKVSVL